MTKRIHIIFLKAMVTIMCVCVCLYVCLMNGFISLPQLHEVFPLILKMQGKACMYNQNKKGMIFYVTIIE